MRRIVVTGSECTGKTTLAQMLASYLRTGWVPEFARTYAETIGRELTVGDVDPIAQGQLAALQQAEHSWQDRADVLVCDTDLLSTVVYSRYYYGSCARWIEEAALADRGALYLLADIDLPWAADGIRDRPDDRVTIQERFREVLREFGAEVRNVSGWGDERLRCAISALTV